MFIRFIRILVVEFKKIKKLKTLLCQSPFPLKRVGTGFRVVLSPSHERHIAFEIAPHHGVLDTGVGIETAFYIVVEFNGRDHPVFIVVGSPAQSFEEESGEFAVGMSVPFL